MLGGRRRERAAGNNGYEKIVVQTLRVVNSNSALYLIGVRIRRTERETEESYLRQSAAVKTARNSRAVLQRGTSNSLLIVY